MKEKLNDFGKRILGILSRNDMLILPGQLAFFLLLAVVPTITLIIYFASIFNVSIDFLTNFLTRSFGSEVAKLIIPIINDINLNPSLLVPLFVALYAASGGASSIIVTSNQLYGIENTTFLHRKIKGLMMTLILIILVVFLLLIPVFGDKLIELIRFVNLNDTITKGLTFIIHLSKTPISWLLIFFLIKVIYTMAPDDLIPSNCTTKGSIFTTLGLVISTSIYSSYVNNMAHYDVLYGGLSHFVVLMIWFYIISYIITIGIAINHDDVKIWQNKEKQKKLY
mgnify:CR=1 FL=1